MSDDEGDWENFSVPTFGGSAVVAAAEEEEDLTLQELKAGPAIATPSASQLAEKERKLRQEEEMLANKLKFALLEGETPEQRKLREKKQQEESEMRLMKDDLFGLSDGAPAEASSSVGIAAIPLKTKQDHINFAITCANKLSPSTSIQASTYMMELTNRMKNNLTTETLDALLSTLKTVRETRKTTEVVTTKKSKKEIKAVAKKHADVFGGEDDEEGGKFNASYSHLEDDFM